MKTISIDEECPHCGGTGLYVGMGERNGAAVVCYRCEGTGCFHFKHEYEDFSERQVRDGIVRVYETNPGICIGTGNGHELHDFGGIDYHDWLNGKRFSSGTENRKFTCPAWWFQSADYKKKPKWDECWESLGSSFSRCPHFATKEKCWARWDKENQ